MSNSKYHIILVSMLVFLISACGGGGGGAPPTSDSIAPVVNSFSLPTTSSSLTVSVNGFSASDAVGVTGYLITESASKPSASSSEWRSSVPASFTFSGYGTKTAYAWAKDAAGNISFSLSATVTIAIFDTNAPVVNVFSFPNTSISLTVQVLGLSATDAVGVTGYLITESSMVPSASAAGWSASAPTSYTFSSAGTKTAYAWAKDAAGNVSASRSASVTITPVLKLSTHGTNPAEQTTAGLEFSVTLPYGCSIASSNGVPSSSDVYFSGQLTGVVVPSDLFSQKYDIASRTLTMTLINFDQPLGEFLTIIMTASNGYVPKSTDVVITNFIAFYPDSNPMPSVFATASFE